MKIPVKYKPVICVNSYRLEEIHGNEGKTCLPLDSWVYDTCEQRRLVTRGPYRSVQETADKLNCMSFLKGGDNNEHQW